MADLVCTGAALKCSMGSSPATFSASSQSVVAPTGAGTVSDTAAANAASFGMCQSLGNPQVAAASSAGPLVPQPCLPVIVAPWSPGSTSITIGGLAALDDSGQCACTWGGTITVSSAGQTATTLQ